MLCCKKSQRFFCDYFCDFLANFLRFLQQNLRFALCDLKMQRYFCDCVSWDAKLIASLRFCPQPHMQWNGFWPLCGVSSPWQLPCLSLLCFWLFPPSFHEFASFCRHLSLPFPGILGSGRALKFFVFCIFPCFFGQNQGREGQGTWLAPLQKATSLDKSRSQNAKNWVGPSNETRKRNKVTRKPHKPPNVGGDTSGIVRCRLSGPISRDIAILSLRYPISRDSFSGRLAVSQNGVIPPLDTWFYTGTSVRYPVLQRIAR